MQLHEPVHVLHDPVRIPELTQAVLRHARADDLVMMECHAVGGDAPGGRLADVVQEPGQAEHGVGLEPLDRGERVAQHVLVSVDGVLLEAQGRHLRDEPVRQARLDEQGQPRAEGSPTSSLSSSSRIRSGETMQTLPHPPDRLHDPGRRRNAELRRTKRAARTMPEADRPRTRPRDRGGVSSRFAARSFTPSNGSTNARRVAGSPSR